MPTGGDMSSTLRVDQEQVRAGIVDDAQHREARQPGGVGLPFEPGEVLGHLGRRHQIFLDVVEAAAMHLPFLAEGAGGQAGPLAQAEIERDEIEGRTDPGDAGDTCSQRTAKLSQSQKIAKSVIASVPACPVTLRAVTANGKGRSARGLSKKIWKILGSPSSSLRAAEPAWPISTTSPFSSASSNSAICRRQAATCAFRRRSPPTASRSWKSTSVSGCSTARPGN